MNSQRASRIFLLFLAAIAFTTTTWAKIQETVLYAFQSIEGNGADPRAGIIFDAAGNLYGTAQSGGTFDQGVVFELSPVAGGEWTEQVIYNFAGGSDGGAPADLLVFDAIGNLYGTTRTGGSSNICSNGCGQVFELSPTAGEWTKTTVHSFTGAGDGAVPDSGVILDATGNLYGTTIGGGAHTFGAVYKLSSTASGWTETVLYSFKGAPSSANPESSLVFDAEGKIYGTTYQGGSSTACYGGCGTIYQLTPPPAGDWWTYRELHSFNLFDGEIPSLGSLVLDAAGNLYGTTTFGGTGSGQSGTIYELSPTAGGGWKETVLHSFTVGYDGSLPQAGLVFDAAGNLWGTTSGGGGSNGYGTVYELTPVSGGLWSYARVYAFQESSTGTFPYGSVVFDAAGNLYSTTANASGNRGTIFELSPIIPGTSK